ncbi:MAG: hypothetical protein JRG80_21130 [Deltaproteobacteria bacterium]|nr:hypothetical protein [Deltaproteobacteria bacterium]
MTALTMALPLAEASGAVITPTSQNRSVAVEVRNYHWSCEDIQQDVSCNFPIVIITDETLNDGQIASGFGPFSANTLVPVEGTNSWATQESAISGASLTASGAFYADGEERRYVEFPFIYHQQYIDSQVETRYSVTFSLDEASAFYLNGDFELRDSYCHPSELGVAAQVSLTLTGPGGAVVDAGISIAVGDCFPTLALREAGQLDPGVYTLEVMATGEGRGYCFGFFGQVCMFNPTYGEFSLMFALGPRPVPALPSRALGLLAALLATLGATSLFPRK